MPVVQPPVLNRHIGIRPGGMTAYGADRLFEEVTYVAYYLHWSLEDILDLDHRLRQRFVEEIGNIHRRMAEED